MRKFLYLKIKRSRVVNWNKKILKKKKRFKMSNNWNSAEKNQFFLKLIQK